MYSLHFYANEWSHNRYLPAKLAYARKKGIAVIVTEFGMSAASGDGGISKTYTGKWLTRLNKANVSYFCWSLSNKNESASGGRRVNCLRQAVISERNTEPARRLSEAGRNGKP